MTFDPVPTDKEKLLELKYQAELALKQFKHYLKEINALNFNVHVQANDTVYVFKDHREAYGDLLPQQKPQQNGGIACAN